MRKISVVFKLLLCLFFIQLSAHENHSSVIKQEEERVYLNQEGIFFREGTIYLDVEGNSVQIFSDAPEAYTSLKKEKSRSQVSNWFKVSFQDLIFDGENIFISRGREEYLITALQREGNQWLANTILLARYCPEGHNLCNHCGLCHLIRCRYYIPPCWK